MNFSEKARNTSLTDMATARLTPTNEKFTKQHRGHQTGFSAEMKLIDKHGRGLDHTLPLSTCLTVA